MASVNDDTDQVRFSNDVEVASIRVKAIFSGVTKDSLDVYPKTLTLRNLKIPLHRFGTWVFELSKNEDEEKEIARNMGHIASFIWSLRKSYPEVSVWVEDPSNCNFVLEFEKGKQAHYSNEIGSSNMKEKLRDQLKKIGDLTLKMIRIPLIQQPSVRKVVTSIPQENVTGAVSGTVESKKTNETAEDSQPPTDAVWRCRKLKADIEKEKDEIKKLLLHIKLAVASYEIGKIDDVTAALDEVRTSISQIRPPREKTLEILKNLRKLSSLYDKDGKQIESIEILLLCAQLVHKMKKRDGRLEQVNKDIAKVCELVSKIYKVKTKCIQTSVNEDDELGRPKQGRGAESLYKQARRLQRKGNLAFDRFKLDNALGHHEAAAHLQPKEAIHVLDKARVYLAKGNLESAENLCNKALSFDITNTEKAKALDLLGEVRYRSYRAFEAFDLFQRSASSFKTPEVAGKIGDLNNAFLTFQRAVDLQRFSLPLFNPFAIGASPFGFP